MVDFSLNLTHFIFFNAYQTTKKKINSSFFSFALHKPNIELDRASLEFLYRKEKL